MELDKSKIYYVYEWYNVDTGEIFYVGKGRGDRCSNKAPANRNAKFIEYLRNNPNSTYRKVFENINEETACGLEDKRIKELKLIGMCSCNLVDRTTHRGILYGEDNGFYGKKHTPEALAKMSAANSNGRNAGENNSQYGISPKDRMTPEVYAVWRQKQIDNKLGTKNGRAYKIIAYNDTERIEFNYIQECVDFLYDKFKLTCTKKSAGARISECIRCGLQYCGYCFVFNDNSKTFTNKKKTTIALGQKTNSEFERKAKELNIPMTSIIEFLMKYAERNNLELFPIAKSKTKGCRRTLRIDSVFFDKWYIYINKYSVSGSSAITQLVEKFLNGEICYEI